MILKLGMQHCGLKLYKVYINGDPWLTLSYFRSPVRLNGETVTKSCNWGKLATKD